MRYENSNESRVSAVFARVLPVLVASLLVGCGATGGYREAGSTKTTSEVEIPGSDSPIDLSPVTAQQYVDQVRIGSSLDPEGNVPEESEGRDFDVADEICVSMEVTDAPAGSKVRVSVIDAATNREVWTSEKAVLAGKRYLGFNIARGELDRGAYRAEVVIGDETVARLSFEVSVGG